MLWRSAVSSGVVWCAVVWCGDEIEESDEWCICCVVMYGNVWHFLFLRDDLLTCRYVTPLKETLTKMLSGELSLDAFPSLLPMPDQVRMYFYVPTCSTTVVL